eukprot:4886002-Lingulodinium_polyedra.AAC.1
MAHCLHAPMSMPMCARWAWALTQTECQMGMDIDADGVCACVHASRPVVVAHSWPAACECL